MPKLLSISRHESPGRWSAEHARQILARQEASGLSIVAFARREGLVAQRLYWWRSRLSVAGDDGGAPEFVEVTPQRVADNRGVVEVVLRSGRVLRVSEGIDSHLLRRLADALEQDESC
jgi:transposase-like protein